MSLIDELATLSGERVKRGPRCTVGVLLESLPDNERDALTETLDNAQIALTAIARVLDKAGHTISAITLARHRKRGTADGCRCDK